MKRPNVLILYTDQQRWDALGANGNREIKTPHLDELAAEGVNFDHHFVQNPVCMPSRVSFLTGQYPSTLGITHMGVPVPENTLTLPRMLAHFGFTSANIGKLHFLPHANRDHREVHPAYGFDHLEISDEPGCYEDAYRAWVRRKSPDALDSVSVGLPPATRTGYQTMHIADTVSHPEARFPKRPIAFPAASDLTHSAFVAEQTMEFIRARDREPFLCIAGFYSPHSPWVAPQEFLDLYDPDSLSIPSFPPEVDAKRADGRCSDDELRGARQGYYAMVSEVDHQRPTFPSLKRVNRRCLHTRCTFEEADLPAALLYLVLVECVPDSNPSSLQLGNNCDPDALAPGQKRNIRPRQQRSFDTPPQGKEFSDAGIECLLFGRLDPTEMGPFYVQRQLR